VNTTCLFHAPLYILAVLYVTGSKRESCSAVPPGGLALYISIYFEYYTLPPKASHFRSLTLLSLRIVFPSQSRTTVPSHCLPLALPFLASFCHIFIAFSQILRFLSSRPLVLLFLASFCPIVFLSHCCSLRVFSQILRFSSSRTAVLLIYFTYSCHLWCNSGLLLSATDPGT